MRGMRLTIRGVEFVAQHLATGAKIEIQIAICESLPRLMQSESLALLGVKPEPAYRNEHSAINI